MTRTTRIVVTGGAGFLGSHLCDRLLLAGHEVLCVDNFSTGSKRNLAHMLGHPRFELLRHDVSLPLYVEADEIYNLACPSSPPHCQQDPVQTIRTSVQGTLHLLGMARRTGARLLQASTSEVYGDPACHPQREDYWGHVNPVGPRACYDEGKRCAETLCFDYRRRYGLRIKIARIFNTYGPRMQADDGRVVSNFVVQALSGHALTVFGDGKQTRSFCYVDDLIDGLLRLIGSADDFCGPVNLGNPTESTILELARQVLALTDSNATIGYAPLPVDDPARRQPDIALALQRLGWQPSVPLHEGLKKTIDYFRGLLPLDPAGTRLSAVCLPVATRCPPRHLRH